MTHTDKFRMYGLVPYNISPIQQAIQYGHALQEYNNMFFEMKAMAGAPSGSGKEGTAEQHEAFDTWRKECKTFIIMNGGTTNYSLEYTGSLNTHLQTLRDMNWLFAGFDEPDLGDQLTAVNFILPEQVYNRKLYPEFWDWDIAKKAFDKRDLDKIRSGNWDWEESFEEHVARSMMLAYMQWTDEVMGGNENVNMRKWVSQFRLA